MNGTGFRFDEKRMSFAQCYVRGFEDEINALIGEGGLKGKVKALDEGISEVKFDYKTNGDIDYIDLLKKHPHFKYCGLVEVFDEEMVYALFSESGSSDVNIIRRAGMFDIKADSMSSGRWAYDGDITKSHKIDFIHHSTDKHIKDKYEFPFEYEWNNNDFVIVKDGKLVHTNSDGIKILKKGKYVAWNKEDNFDIKEGVLLEYLGRDPVVRIPDGITQIALGAFSKCTFIQRIIIPGSLKKLQGDAKGRIFFSTFSRDSRPDLELEEGIETIENISYFTVRKLYLPSTLNRISFKEDSFYGMAGVDDIEIANNAYFEYINGLLVEKASNTVLFAQKTITDVTFPETINKITMGAFSGAEKIKEINIPANITEIPHRCFSGCVNLVDVGGCEGLKEIGFFAFGGCIKLKNISLPDTIEKIDSLSFRGCEALSKKTLKKAEKYYCK